MKIRLLGVELLHADRRTKARTDRYDEADNHFFSILRKRLKIETHKPMFWSAYWNNFFYYSRMLLYRLCVDKHTGKIAHMIVLAREF